MPFCYNSFMKRFITLPKLQKGDTVALISPSNGLPEIFPWVHELGVDRIENEFGLVTKEYPTTRKMGASLEDRARDVMAAFADTDVKAVIATIGGEDQVQLIKYLDQSIIKQNPKPFFGYSDNTHIHNLLWVLGIPSFYGGGVMNQFAMNVAMHDMTKESLRKALFESGVVEIKTSETYNDIGIDWSDKTSLSRARTMEPNDGWVWDGKQDAHGVLWGGCVESLIVQSTANKYLPGDQDMNGVVLIMETAEDIPEHWIIEYLLIGFGERGWFDKFQAILVGRPKAWEFDKQNDTATKTAYRKQQRDSVLKIVRQYNKSIPVVQNLDFGHTDPQICMPLGREVRIDSKNQKIFLSY